MTTVLFELGTEELPPKSLHALEQALAENVRQSLVEQGIAFGELKSYAAPRRLALQIRDVAARQAHRNEQKRGPAIKVAFDESGNLSKAGQGFLQGLKAQGLAAEVGDLTTLCTDKGDYLVYDYTIDGQQTAQLLPAILQNALDRLPIAKRMRSGADKDSFVRPVKWLVLLADEQIINATIQGLKTSNQTRGHRFHAPEWRTLEHASDYESVLEDAFVLPDFAKRRQKIRSSVQALADSLGAVAMMPDDLLDEVTALVDYPVALLANFPERFLSVPQEALISTMQTDQKYFCLTKDDQLLPNFIFISNIDAVNPQNIIAGNEKVVRPRLADAEFFFVQDQKKPLADYALALKQRVFQDKLGTFWDKTKRLSCLAGSIAEQIGADVAQVERAASLAKADLATTFVQEFPELQGIAGAHYARLSGETQAVSSAIAEQYLPKFSGDRLPISAVGMCLAVADRADTLAGIFAIGGIPTGSKDPFALRRASIGLLRLLIDKKLPLNVSQLMQQAVAGYGNTIATPDKVFAELMGFINARYRAMYEEQNVPADSMTAVLATGVSVPMDVAARIAAVQSFRELPEATALAESNKRVANILAKATDLPADGLVREDLLHEDAEKTLLIAITNAQKQLEPLQETQQYLAMLTTLTMLAVPLRDFFAQVMVNVDDLALKNNRLTLLKKVRELFLQVADIGQLQW